MAAKGSLEVNIKVEHVGKTPTGGTTTGGGATGSGTTNVNEARSLFDIQRQLTKEYRASASANGEISEQTKKLKAQLEEVNGKVRKFNEYGRENKNTWGNALNSYQFKFNALGNIIANVTSTAANMLKQLGSSVVTISKDFEFAMSGVRAITQATDAEFKALTADAIRLGGATLYTARQVADLQTELAKLGFTVPEIRAATDGVVALAAATGEDLGQSALVAGTVIRGFNLRASELTRVVDVMAQSFNASALDLYKFQETMKYVAPVASKTGFTMEEVTAIMAKLADQGVVASQAGTSLRNLFLRLADANSKLSKAIGFTVKSLPELVVGFRDLNEAGLDATRALSLADRYSVTALLGLAQQADGIWELYKSLVSTADAAERMSETRMDNFAGSIEKLTGAWDSLVLTINKGNGVLRTFIDIGTGALEFLQENFGSYQGKIEQSSIAHFQAFKKIVESDIREKKKNYIRDAENLMEQVDRQIITKEEFSKKSTELEAEYETYYKQNIKDRLASEIEVVGATIKVWEESGIAKNASQKKLLDSQKLYLKELLNYETEINSQRTQALVDSLLEQQQAEEDAYWKIRQLRVDAMTEGLNKELEEVKLRYDKLEAEAAAFGVTDIDFTRAREQAKLNVIKEYNEKQKKAFDDRNKQNDINFLKPRKQPIASSAEQREIEKGIFDRFENERKAYAKLAKSTMKIAPDVGVTAPNIWDDLAGITDLSSEQKQALEKGINYITDAIDELADKEAEIADRRVENSERVVNQLQQDLENEMRLAELGYANNVTLKRKELEDAKKRQAEALKAQEIALKRQRQLESASQTIDLLSATASILKNSFKTGDPISASIIAGIALVGMWGTWAWSLSKASEATKFGDGGEVVGAKHSQGGVPIEAEGGEFVVKASAYSKYADLVNAINEDKVNSVYGSMNRDLTVSLDDKKYDRMMGKYFGSTRTTYHNGYKIEQSGNRTRTIRYA
jgi:TP901 family phage tail tape measure protein